MSLADVESIPADQQQYQTPGRLELQAGDRAMMACSVRGLPRPSVRWYHNDVVVEDGSSRVHVHEDGLLELGDLQPSDSGRYRCRVEAGTETKYGNVTQLVVDSTGKCK